MKYPKKLCFLAIVLTACLLVGGNVLAQTTQVTVSGTVLDDDNAPLPGVSITIKNAETGYTKSTVTRNDGTYIISGLQPGKYEIEVGLSGFATQIRRGLTFSVGAELTLDFMLTAATIEEEVTVIAESPMVEVTKSEISSVVDREKIDALPLLDRDYGALTIMKAGVQSSGERSNAQPYGSGEVLTDGISNEWVGRNTIRSQIPADAIQEFRVMTNQFEAEYGNASGMIRSAITRSGTNDFRGRLAFFYRDEIFDDVNYFIKHNDYEGPEVDYEKVPFSRYNYAGFLGGPLIKDKAHFFVSYDGYSYNSSNTVNIPGYTKETVPYKDKRQMLMGKFNYQANEKNLFAFRYTLDRPSLEDWCDGGSFDVSTGYDWKEYTHEFQANWTFYPSDKTMNELRAFFSYNKYDVICPNDEYFIIRPSGYFGPYPNLPQWADDKRYQIVDNFSIFAGDHSIKFGFDASLIKDDGEIYQYVPGMYIFGTDAPFNPADFSTYPIALYQADIVAPLVIDYSEVALFVQDSWKVNPNLTLNIGLRWNYYTCTDMEVNNFNIRALNPRFGFSWDPIGDGKTSIRGGVGTYSQNPQANIGLLVGLMGALSVKTYLYPGYPDPSVPNPFVPFEIDATPPEDLYRAEGTLVAPYTLQSTLGFQREFITDLSLGADLVWSRGFNFTRFENANGIIPGTAVLRPDMSIGDDNVITGKGKSDYKALYLTLSKRYSHGWSLDISYTLGRSWSDVETEQTGQLDNEDDIWERMYGPNNADATHRIAVTGIVDLPWDFQVSGLAYYRSAVPFTAYYANDINLDGTTTDMVDDYRNARRGYDQLYINMRLSKYFTIDRFRIQLFGELYNITNRNNFLEVHNVYDTPNFGNPISAGDPRRIQLGARIDF